MLNMEKDLLIQELKTSKDIIEKWIKRIEADGIPKEDFPSSAEGVMEWRGRLCGELAVSSGKLETIQAILVGSL